VFITLPPTTPTSNRSIDIDKVDTPIVEVDTPIVEVDTAIVEVDTAIVEVDTQIVEVDTAIVEVDTQIVEVDTQIVEVDTQIVEVDTQIVEVDTPIVEAAIQGASVLKVSLVMNVPWGSWDHSKGSFLSAPGAGNKTVWVEEKSSLLEAEGLEVSLFAAPDGAVSANGWAITPWDNSGTGDVTFIVDMQGCYHVVNFNHALVTVGHVIKAFHIALTFAGGQELHVSKKLLCRSNSKQVHRCTALEESLTDLVTQLGEGAGSLERPIHCTLWG